jgi:uncharacterized phage protein gp47/JayE
VIKVALIKRTADEILSDALRRIKENTPITNFKPGAIARAIAESMKDELPKIYDYAEEVLHMGFLSRAKKEYLDLIGQLFSYPRRTITKYDAATGKTKTEYIDDDMYRYEISQRVLTAANANYQSVRLKVLAVDGVSDVIGKEYTHGTGSFSLTIIPEYGFTLSTIMSGVEVAVQDVKAYGIRPHIVFPKQVPLELQIQLMFHESVSNSDKDKIRSDLKSALYTYFANFKMGQAFIYNDFVQQVMNGHEKIVDFSVVKFYLNNEPALLTNQTIFDDEMIVPTYIEII